MATPQPATRLLQSSALPLAAKRDFAALINSKGSNLPNRYILHGREGWGKTSFAAMTPRPIFIETKGETGLETLIDAGQLPPVPHFPEAQTWGEMLDMLEWLRAAEHQHKTVVLDTVNGAERLCHEEVCRRDFGGEWGDKGFAAYGKGPDVALADWRGFLALLDAIRRDRQMTIFLLCHTKIEGFRNPEGADYDRYQPDLNKKTWSLTHKWSDCVLFGNFETIVGQVQENKKTGAQKGKAIGQNRLMLTENHAAYDAKNRLGLAPEIEMGNSPQEAWGNFSAALKEGRKTMQEESTQ